MKLTVTSLERPSCAMRHGLHSYICTGECLVQACPNTGAVFGRTNHTFGGTLSYVLLLFSTLAYLPSCLVFVGVHYAGT